MALDRKSGPLSIHPAEYLSAISHPPHRQALLRLVTAEHGLAVEIGRRRGLPRELRLCRLCGAEVEDEIHILLECTGDPEVPSARSEWLSALRERKPRWSPREGLSREEQVALVGRWLHDKELLPLLARTVHHILSIVDFLWLVRFSG